MNATTIFEHPNGYGYIDYGGVLIDCNDLDGTCNRPLPEWNFAGC